MNRRLKVAAVVFATLAGMLFALLPPSTVQTAPPPASTVRGAFHIHSDRSDGSGTPDEIAAAAARAGLQFVIITDHGDGTRSPDPPSYRSGVLTIDAVELNTTGGHYAAIGLPASPYPLAGTPGDVIADVHRLGGFGIAAHPGSSRPSLSWQDWESPIDGLEWINADSEWRDEPRLPIARALVTYFFRAPQSIAVLLDRPDAMIRQWDRLALTRKVIGLAGADAHARLGLRQRTDPDVSSIHLPVPSYESSFRAFANHVVLDRPMSGDAAADAARLLTAIRSGHVYSVIEALARPGALSFTATSGSQTAQMGDHLAVTGDVLLRAVASAPRGTSLVLLRNGERVHEVTDGPLDMNGGTDGGVYRVEAYTAGAPGGPSVPWIVSNPIYVGMASADRPGDASPPFDQAQGRPPASRIPARTSEASGESGPSDSSAIEASQLTDPRARRFAGDPAIAWSFALAPGTAVGQFAAVRVPVAGLAAFDRVRFRVTAAAPMRVWVQLRAPVGNTERWGATFYADEVPRMIDVAFAKFNAIGQTSSPRAPLDRVDSLLWVVDTLNTLPGRKGRLTISEVAFVR